MHLPAVPLQLQHLVDDYHTHSAPEHQLQTHTVLVYMLLVQTLLSSWV